MGLTITLETERGEQRGAVYDPANVLHGLLPSADDRSSCVLRHIDWYGNTVFNRLQIEGFLQEWRTLSAKAWSEEARSIVDQVEELALKCRDGVHLYLKFIGD